MTPVLDVRGVARRFGDVEALRGVDLAISAGEVVGLLGPNGAGKTTLVRTVATLVEPDRGTVAVCGIDASADPAGVRAHIGLAGQYASVDEVLTGRENLVLIGRLYGIAADECTARAADLLRAIGLEGAADRRVGTYSGGMRRRLDLGATLIGEPSLLLLDEPTAGLDPRSRNDLWELIDEIADRGAAVLVTSQHLDEVERLADRVVVLRDGAVIADDRPHELRQRIGGRVLDLTVDGARTSTPAPDGIESVRRVLDDGVAPTELALRGPSLEEVFLALTGDTPHDEVEEVVGARTSLAARTRPSLTRSTVRDVAAVTGRYWKHVVRTPQVLFFATVQPVLFVLGLHAVFSGLVEQVVGDDYIQYLLPGVIVMNLALAAGATGVGLATDLRDGIVDRFRSLPMAHVAVLVGRTTTDLFRSAMALVVMLASGHAVGFRFEGGPGGAVAALGLALAFGYAATWLFAAVGLAVRDPAAATFLGFAPVLVFVYLSSAWVPIESMDGAVRSFARHQPVNVTIEAVRALANGTGGVGRQVVQSLAWSVGLALVFGTIATRTLRRATA